MNQELKSTFNKKSKEMKSIQDSNEKLQSSLQKTQIDILDVDDATFDKEKAQVLCLYPDLDLFEMDFFKVVVNVHLCFFFMLLKGEKYIMHTFRGSFP